MKPKQTAMWLGLETQSQVDRRQQIAEERQEAFEVVIKELREQFADSPPEIQDEMIRDLVAVAFTDIGPDDDSATDPRF